MDGGTNAAFQVSVGAKGPEPEPESNPASIGRRDRRWRPLPIGRLLAPRVSVTEKSRVLDRVCVLKLPLGRFYPRRREN
jgi:hypothetical protein